ncbi:MAG: hypothetical protein ACE15F_24400 [bacterium]
MVVQTSCLRNIWLQAGCLHHNVYISVAFSLFAGSSEKQAGGQPGHPAHRLLVMAANWHYALGLTLLCQFKRLIQNALIQGILMTVFHTLKRHGYHPITTRVSGLREYVRPRHLPPFRRLLHKKSEMVRIF